MCGFSWPQLQSPKQGCYEYFISFVSNIGPACDTSGFSLDFESIIWQINQVAKYFLLEQIFDVLKKSIWIWPVYIWGKRRGKPLEYGSKGTWVPTEVLVIPETAILKEVTGDEKKVGHQPGQCTGRSLKCWGASKVTSKLIKTITSRYGQLISNRSVHGCGLSWGNTRIIKLVESLHKELAPRWLYFGLECFIQVRKKILHKGWLFQIFKTYNNWWASRHA